MSNRIFYTMYRLFESVHGTGDAAEVAALVTWCLLLIFNVGTVAILLIVATGNPPVLRGHILNVFVVAGIVIAITQYVRYLRGGRIDKLVSGFRGESASARTRRRWLSFGYSSLTLLMLIGSIWLLNAAA